MMIFCRPDIPHSPTHEANADSLLLAGERRRAIALEQHLDLALGLLQLRRSGTSKLDAFLECRDRLLQREASSLEPLHHLGEARNDVLVLLRDGWNGCVGHANSSSTRRLGFLLLVDDLCRKLAFVQPDAHPLAGLDLRRLQKRVTALVEGDRVPAGKHLERRERVEARGQPFVPVPPGEQRAAGERLQMLRAASWSCSTSSSRWRARSRRSLRSPIRRRGSATRPRSLSSWPRLRSSCPRMARPRRALRWASSADSSSLTRAISSAAAVGVGARTSAQ